MDIQIFLLKLTQNHNTYNSVSELSTVCTPFQSQVGRYADTTTVTDEATVSNVNVINGEMYDFILGFRGFTHFLNTSWLSYGIITFYVIISKAIR